MDRRPDILFRVLDTLRVDRLSCYGFPATISPSPAVYIDGHKLIIAGQLIQGFYNVQEDPREQKQIQFRAFPGIEDRLLLLDKYDRKFGKGTGLHFEIDYLIVQRRLQGLGYGWKVKTTWHINDIGSD